MAKEITTEISEFIENYKNSIGLYQELVNEVIYTIQEESKLAGLKYADLKGRVKTVESIQEKIERLNILKPSEEIYDYAGTRIVCLFEEEKEKFGDLIERVFEVTWKDNKKQKHVSNQMGYQSLHFSVKFGKNYSGPRYNKFINLVCEVQITTVLLEAWALINHTISYKNESAIPIEIQRDINKVSSLLEVAQKVFDDSYNKRKEYLTKIENSVHDRNLLLSQPINFDTLSLFSKTLYPSMEISEFLQNKLIEDLNKDKFKTLNDINDALIKSKTFIESYKRERPELFKYSTDILMQSLGFSDSDFRIKHKFAQVILSAFDRLKNNYAS